MFGNGSVRKKVDLIWSVVSSSRDSALEGDRECVQGRTPPRSGLSDKRKGIYEASRCQARSTRLVHIDTGAWRPQEGRLATHRMSGSHQLAELWRLMGRISTSTGPQREPVLYTAA
jgi:hypothetical protein